MLRDYGRDHGMCRHSSVVIEPNSSDDMHLSAARQTAVSHIDIEYLRLVDDEAAMAGAFAARGDRRHLH
jgi:hypothetical protein